MQILENYSWIKKIDRALLDLDEAPLLRTKKEIDWEGLSNHFAKKLELKNLKISPAEPIWRSLEDLTTGLSENVSCLGLIASGLEGELYWLMAEEDIAELANLSLLKKEEKTFLSAGLTEGFYRFLCLKGMNFLSEFKAFEGVSFKMLDAPKPLEEPALCLDIKIEVDKHHLFARIALTNKFRTSWEKYFADNPLARAQELKETLELPITIEAGKTTLSYDSFKQIKIGDFVILDKIYYNPKKGQNDLLLSLANNPLFYAKVKQNKIKLTNFAFYYEEDETMPNINEESKELAEEEVRVEGMQESPIGAISEMPIVITVEIAKIKITLEKLMSLQPGNLLDLNVNPQKELTLTVNGKSIGKAELLNLGETLGVRITELG
ncbi:MAG: type III secretion system cytoplasmic ring protein SctQ [Chlamydiae bacterium]|nr:type III secretion system cytoplasmic ring protein SctQ [Chlamydiota bacterium]